MTRTHPSYIPSGDLASVQDVQAHPVHDRSRLPLQRRGRVVPAVRGGGVRLPRGQEVPSLVVDGG